MCFTGLFVSRQELEKHRCSGTYKIAHVLQGHISHHVGSRFLQSASLPPFLLFFYMKHGIVNLERKRNAL